MLQVNMLEAKSDLSKLVKMLETGAEDVIYIARNGIEVAQLSLIQKPQKERIGIAKGCFKVPDDFDSDNWNAEIEDLFENGEI